MKRKRKCLKVLVIFLTLLLFGVLGIFSSCTFFTGEVNESTTETTVVSESTNTETTAAETTATETTAPPETTAAETTATETTAPPETTVPETTVPPETTPPSIAPTIKLSIYEGPTHSLAGDLCYYRIQATVTGSPSPTITFSKDDSNGAWGKNKVQVNLSRTNPDYTLTATAKNSAGTATASIKISWGCGPLVAEITPTIKLSIYEGPTHSLAGDLCYYRIQATVTGSPSPTITFSKDDSNGAWGKNKVQVNLSRTNPDYTLTATAKNSAGTATASINLSWGCGILEKTMIFYPSDLTNIDSDGIIDNGTVHFGDSATDKDIRGFFAFDISPLKEKNLISASIKLIDPQTTAKIDFKGNIQVWYVDFLAGGITGSDYMNTPYSGPQSFNWNADPIQFSTDFLKNIISDRAGAQRKLEFGIWFEDSTIGGDSGVKELRDYHSNDITLTVVYEQ